MKEMLRELKETPRQLNLEMVQQVGLHYLQLQVRMQEVGSQKLHRRLLSHEEPSLFGGCLQYGLAQKHKARVWSARGAMFSSQTLNSSVV